LPALGCLACSGGGGAGLNPVQGKVLYKNQPLKGALVTFHPKGAANLNTLRPTGLTGEDGRFKVVTGEQDGAPAGGYVVTFVCSEEVKPKKPFAMEVPEIRDRFRGTYANREASKFTVEIKNGVNQLEPFNLN